MENKLLSTLFALGAFLTILLSIQPARAADWQYSYCSSLNTGEQDTQYNWPYQSNGNCTNHCTQEGGSWAFAVIQYTECWCSNYVPGDTSSSSDCLVDCPGFPDEKCGNKDKDLFIYVQMDGQPSGTKGGSQPTSTAAAPSKSEPKTTQPPTSAPPPPQVVTSILTQNPETVYSTVTVKPPSPSSSSSSSTSTSESEKEEPSSTKTSETEDSPSATEQPVTMPTVVTESGNVITRTVVISPTSPASAIEEPEEKSNVGAIAGGVAGGVVGLVAIVGGIFFFLWRKRRQQQQDGHDSSGITRNVSTMSRSGLLGRSEKSPSPLVTTFGSQRSRHDDDSITPVTPSTRRLSQPILVDSRLNPTAVLTFHGANQSRESFGSIDDSRDYGRQLNVRNPDP